MSDPRCSQVNYAEEGIPCPHDIALACDLENEAAFSRALDHLFSLVESTQPHNVAGEFFPNNMKEQKQLFELYYPE